jgi:hypothetical protein
MLLYYYTELNLVAMWYYNDKMELRTWVEYPDNRLSSLDHKAAHRNLAHRRRATDLEDQRWCELLYDSGDE